ncbi:MAG TPA: Kdo hydroxylase family protein [Candidatus Dormibacteraeota bacterium]|nr:Kdo hydroxylase family protein [Candidatus Dormibacteraeota bacterium]
MRSRTCCELLETGKILCFAAPPFELPAEDREFLVSQPWSELRLHKNVSYRPGEDVLRGVGGDPATENRVHSILRNFSTHVLQFAADFLAPYASKWIVDFSSFRPLEEQRRDLPLHKRNDLLHVDAFPSRPTRGGRILRIFTNLNPSKVRVWNTAGDFDALARKYAADAGLQKYAAESPFGRLLHGLSGMIGAGAARRTPYDAFMLRFHDYLKENSDFQSNYPKSRLEFSPLSTWLVFTDGVAHAAMSGQYALEQTLLIPPEALVAPEQAPYRILESIAGKTLVS